MYNGNFLALAWNLCEKCLNFAYVVCVFTLQVKCIIYVGNSNFRAISPLIQNSFTLDVKLVGCEIDPCEQFRDKELCTLKLMRYWGFSHLRLKNKPVSILEQKSFVKVYLYAGITGFCFLFIECLLEWYWFRQAKWRWHSDMTEIEWRQTTQK